MRQKNERTANFKNHIMIKKIIVLLFISFGLFSCNKTDKEILEKTIDRLNSLETIDYDIITHYLCKDMGMDKIDSASCYFDFTKTDSLIGANYQIIFPQGLQIYNGKQAFSLEKNDKRIIYTNDPKLYDASSSIFMANSIWTLKKLLPDFVQDTTVTIERINDTIINGVNNYVFNIAIKDRYINIGAVLTESKGKTSNLNLYVSQDTYLPTEFKTVFPENKGFWSSTFTNLTLSASRPDSIWELDKLPKEYLRLSKKELFESYRNKATQQIGEKATDWKLPLLNSNDSIQLSSLSGNLVLLEFWFPYCRGCVKSIPDINQIMDSYKEKGLKIYGIEFGQSNDKGLNDYVQKQKINYPTLHTGKNVAQEYGIDAAPTFYLIDKKGLILYTSVGLDKVNLIKSIEENL